MCFRAGDNKYLLGPKITEISCSSIGISGWYCNYIPWFQPPLMHYLVFLWILKFKGPKNNFVLWANNYQARPWVDNSRTKGYGGNGVLKNYGPIRTFRHYYIEELMDLRTFNLRWVTWYHGEQSYIFLFGKYYQWKKKKKKDEANHH